MIINFEKNIEKKEPTKEELFEAERQDIIRNLGEIDVDDALRGAIMLATGQNTILGVDYTLQKNRCIEAAIKHDETMAKIRHLLSQVVWVEDE